MTATKGNIINASDILTATEIANNYLGKTATATAATKIIQDSAGQQINTTYIKGISASGSTITYTKGDGTTGTTSVSSSGISLSSNVTVTKSTQSSFDTIGYNGSPSSYYPYTKDYIKTAAGTAAGTYTLQNLLQDLVNKSHTHTESTLYVKCDCSNSDGD